MENDQTTDQASAAFIDNLLVATKNIKEQYFKLPEHGGRHSSRERVYCYELYHQLRLLMPKYAPFGLMGEIDKSGHKTIRHTHAAGTVPDLLLHEAGTHENNIAVVEIKHTGGPFGGIDGRKASRVARDLEKLTTFSTPLYKGGKIGYRTAIFLVFGEEENFDSKMRKRAKEWEEAHPDMIKLHQIKCYWHKKAEEPAELVKW